MSKLNPYFIVYVDDEALALKYFEKGFAQDFNILTASNAAEGWTLIQQHHAQIGVLMSDQRMPGESGVQLLERVRRKHPQIIRFLVTAYSDIDSAIAGVNEGAIYRYVNKPWDVTDLRINLLRALEYFSVLVERDHLIREKLSVLQQIVLSDRAKNLGVLAAGLGSRFQHTLRAARRFFDAIPHAAPSDHAVELEKGGIGRNLENQIKRASADLFQIATVMSELAEENGPSESAPIALATLLAPLMSGPTPPGRGSVRLEIDPETPALRASPKQMVKAVSLLISTLAAVSDQAVPIHLRVGATKDERGTPVVRMALSDEGADWPPERCAQLFAPFAAGASPESRVGLDLAVAYFLIHHHGGSIDISGNKNGRITVHLPLAPENPEAVSIQQSQLDELFHRERSWDDFLAPPGAQGGGVFSS